MCIRKYLYIVTEGAATAGSLEVLPLSDPEWLKGWAREGGNLLDSNKSCRQLDIHTLQLCSPTLAELEQHVALNFSQLFSRVAEISSFSSNPGESYPPNPEQTAS